MTRLIKKVRNRQLVDRLSGNIPEHSGNINRQRCLLILPNPVNHLRHCRGIVTSQWPSRIKTTISDWWRIRWLASEHDRIIDRCDDHARCRGKYERRVRSAPSSRWYPRFSWYLSSLATIWYYKMSSCVNTLLAARPARTRVLFPRAVYIC